MAKWLDEDATCFGTEVGLGPVDIVLDWIGTQLPDTERGVADP